MLTNRLLRHGNCSGEEWSTGVLPRWAAHGPSPWGVLVWLPLLLTDPALSIGSAHPHWLGALVLVAISATFAAAVFTAHRQRLRDRYVPDALLFVLLGLVVAASAFGEHWYILFTLQAIATGVVIRPRWAAPAIVSVTGLCAGVISAHSGWGPAWGNALSVFLSGAATFLFYRLLVVVAELNRTREELARTAVSEERLRFSRDLHDLLGHTLSVMVVKAEVVRRLAARDPDLAIEHARDIEAIGREGLVEVREAVNGYRGPRLAVELDRARIGLAAAGIDVDIVEAGGPVPPDTDTLFGWIVREGVTNVIRHSGADNCTISVRVAQGNARLDLTDDGDGASDSPDGGGLRGLRERVAAAGGTVEAGLLPAGFGIAVDIPSPTLAGADTA